jgi:hypothetical protein
MVDSQICKKKIRILIFFCSVLITLTGGHFQEVAVNATLIGVALWELKERRLYYLLIVCTKRRLL